MPKMKVRLLRPLDGHEIGKVMAFDSADAERLSETGAVTILGPERPPRPRKPERGAAKQAAAPSNKKASAPENKSA